MRRILTALVLFAPLTWAQTPPTASPPTPPSAKERQEAAIRRQKEAIRKQAEDVGVWMVPGRPLGTDESGPAAVSSPSPQTGAKAGCDALGESAVAPLIDGAARAQSVNPKILRAVIEQESGYKPCALSPKGAKGLMQLMPDTAADLGVADPYDPRENIEAGAKYLRQMLDKYKGDLSQALGAYNAGPGAVDQAGGIPNIKETRDYVQSIMQKVGSIPIDPPSIQTPKPIEN